MSDTGHEDGVSPSHSDNPEGMSKKEFTSEQLKQAYKKLRARTKKLEEENAALKAAKAAQSESMNGGAPTNGGKGKL